MLAIIIFLIGLVFLLGLVYWYRRPANFPPGPRGIPILGTVMEIGTQNMGEVFFKWRDEYGPVMSARVGKDDWVILNNFDVVHKALVKQGSVFSGRPSTPLLDFITQGKGLALLDYGHNWKVQRTFGIKSLRGFGIGKQGMESKILEEMEYMTDRIKKSNSQPINSKTALTLAVSNVICNVVFGKRFEYDDKVFNRIVNILNEAVSTGTKAAVYNLLNMAFWMRHMPFIHKYWVIVQEEMKEFLGTFRMLATQHEESYDENNIRDFIDEFLTEIKKKSDPSFELPQLYQFVRDLFEGGTETTSSTLQWSILAFLTFPECQDKIFIEVEEVMGDANPTMKHQHDMPYTCAFLQEIKRHRTLLPISVMHKTNESIVFEGYTIPKNTTVVPNLWAVHHDPDYFENPMEFNPERFIDSDGKFQKSPHVIPFSVGPRFCLGQQLADMELFIFLTKIVQQFKISKPEDEKLPDFNSGIFSFAYTAHPFNAIFTPRE